MWSVSSPLIKNCEGFTWRTRLRVNKCCHGNSRTYALNSSCLYLTSCSVCYANVSIVSSLQWHFFTSADSWSSRPHMAWKLEDSVHHIPAAAFISHTHACETFWSGVTASARTQKRHPFVLHFCCCMLWTPSCWHSLCSLQIQQESWWVYFSRLRV